MKRYLLVFPFLWVFSCVALAQLNPFFSIGQQGSGGLQAQQAAGAIGPGNSGGGSQNIATCTASTNLQARMDGTQNSRAVDTAICGMVTDGTLSLLDGLYVAATSSVGNSLLNWVQNAFNLTSHGSITFTANQGWTGDGSTGYYSTGFTPSTAGGQWTLNSATLGGCTITGRTTVQNWVIAGGTDGTHSSYNQPYAAGVVWGISLNDAGGTAPANTSGSARGSLILVRPNNSTLAGYINGALFSNPAKASTALTAAAITILSYNNNGVQGNFNTDQIAYVLFGGALSGTQINTSIYPRLHTYLQSVGETTAC